ncbi:hypothetical protein PAHAL_3G101800 [Panicum hallii]|uniref:Uncharacterized protein n=1 Tax=Panicum hallii TaxID=206008 RepID=A0A2S3H7Y8_9POAL|nr:hypothetical protein PAHAL_3G101800 [Panicum hallii]
MRNFTAPLVSGCWVARCRAPVPLREPRSANELADSSNALLPLRRTATWDRGAPWRSSPRRAMALIAAAAAGARPLLSSAARRTAASLSYAAYSAAGPAAGDIEDSPLPRRSPLAQFRERRALAVTDITATEWCEKQMESGLKHGKPERTEAMKAGSDRHAQLEDEKEG